MEVDMSVLEYIGIGYLAGAGLTAVRLGGTWQQSSIDSIGARIIGAMRSRIKLYRENPMICKDSSCEGRSYLIPDDIVGVGVTCGDYVHVQFRRKSHVSAGWVEKKHLDQSSQQ